jgi:hypothetical protein
MITMITIAPKLINMEYSSGVCLGVKRGCLIRLNRAGGLDGGGGGRVADANRGSAVLATS